MFHFGSPVNDWPRAVAQLPAGYVIKAIDNVQMLDEAKRVNPDIQTILRHWYDPGQVFGGTIEENRQRARVFFDTFIDGTFMQYAHHVDYIEGWNEYNANGHTSTEVADRIRWAQAAAYVWWHEYRTRPGLGHIQLILANTAIGNDIPIGIARAAVDYDALLGYHPYWPVKNDYTPLGAWEWYQGRWNAMDATFRAQGIYVRWALTEAGAVRYWGDWPNIGLDPMGGWKHPDCHNGDIGQYLASMTRFMDKWAEWNYLNANRCLPPVLFDSRPTDDEWKHFQVRQPHMDTIAMHVHQWPIGAAPPPPPPPPPPNDECRGTPREQYHRVYNVIPQDATRERAAEIFLHGWDAAKQTAGGSWDDAGVGDLDYRTAVLWDIGDQSTAISWYEDNYPGVQVIFKGNVDTLPAIGSPVDGIPLVVTSPFGVERSYGLHEGLDLRAVDEHGQPVPIVAIADGLVVWASNLRRSDGQPSDYGNHVIVEHDNGLIAWYAHLETLTVQAGYDVRTGDMLGLAGSTGNSTGVHLHLTIQRPGQGLSGYVVRDVIDPVPLLGL